MRINLSDLRKLIRSSVLQETRVRPVETLDDDALRLLGKIARLRPLPAASLRPGELDVVEVLSDCGLVAYDPSSKGFTVTREGLDELERQ